MMRKNIYFVLAIVGAVLPWIYFAKFLAVEGSSTEFIPALFVNGATSGATVDLLISSLVFWILLFREGRLRGMGRLWVYVIVNLLIGLSCALPLFLWAREGRLAAESS